MLARSEETEDLVVELFGLFALGERVGRGAEGEGEVGVDRGERNERFDAAGLTAKDRFVEVDGGREVGC